MPKDFDYFYHDFTSWKPDAYMLKEARLYADLTPQQAADLCGLHRTTYMRQEKGQRRVSVAVFRLIMMHNGYLPPPWQGWRLKAGQLLTPEGQGYSPGDVQSIFWTKQIIEGLKRDLRELQANLDDTEQRLLAYEPPTDNIIPFKKATPSDQAG
jgi:DNA-binding XRE family transcriptional regulator